MSKIQSTLRTLVNLVTGYAAHAAIVAIIALAAHFGFHISVPVLPVAAFTLSGHFALIVILRNLGSAWHSGRIEAELKRDAGNIISTVAGQVISAAEGK